MKTALFSTVGLAAAIISAGCGTSSEGSRYNAQHGVAQDSGYPGGKPVDAESPSIGSLTKEEKAVEEKPFIPPNAPAPRKEPARKTE